MADAPIPPDPLAELQRKIAQLEALLQDSPDDEDVLALLAKRRAQLNELTANTIWANNVVSGIQYNDHRTTNIYGAPKPAPEEDLEARYLRGLRKRLTRLPLGDSDDEAQGVTLDSVYIDLDTTERRKLTKAEQQAYIDEWGRALDDKPISVLEAVTAHTRLVLLGDPGSGKSSFVNHLAAALAAARLDEKQGKPAKPLATPLAEMSANWLPVVMTLRDLVPKLADIPDEGDPATTQQLLCAAVWRQWDEELAKDKASGFYSSLEARLEAGDAVLIFDGLDEVPEAARARVRQAVSAVLRDYPNTARVIITCRTRSYNDALFPSYKKAEVARFDEDKIRRFVAQWYAVRTDPAEAEAKARELAEAVLEPSLRELAENPMLLTTMALLHSRDQGRLPKERAKLYTRAVDVLLERWQKKGIAISPALKAALSDTPRLREMLREVAHRAHTVQQQQRDADLTRGDLLALLEEPRFLGADGPVREFLDYVDQRSGLLIGLGGDDAAPARTAAAPGAQPKTYKFPHRTFQEYLAGCWLVAERGRDTVNRYVQCAQHDDYWTLAAQLGAEELLHNGNRKTDVADLAYALCRPTPTTPQAWRCTLWSGKLAALLGKDYVQSDRQGGPDFLSRLLPQLNALLTGNALPALERAEAGKAIGKLAEPNDPLFAYALDVDAIYKDLCPVPADTFWMGSTDDDEWVQGDEMPCHPCTVGGFRMARFPVTNAQYAAFVAQGGPPVDDYGEPFHLPNHPVVGVSWHQATAFCEWLTQRWRAAGLIQPNEEVRLPSEAEWERAARGGADGAYYAWGDDRDPEKMNTYETRLGGTSAVGCFSLGRNGFGLEEMCGNVWEWTRSLYAQLNAKDSRYEHIFKYPYDAEDGREDMSRDDTWARVLRGGSWDYFRQDARVACRNRLTPGHRLFSSGFRVVCAPVLSPPASENLVSGSLGR